MGNDSPESNIVLDLMLANQHRAPHAPAPGQRSLSSLSLFSSDSRPPEQQSSLLQPLPKPPTQRAPPLLPNDGLEQRRPSYPPHWNGPAGAPSSGPANSGYFPQHPQGPPMEGPYHGGHGPTQAPFSFFDGHPNKGDRPMSSSEYDSYRAAHDGKGAGQYPLNTSLTLPPFRSLGIGRDGMAAMESRPEHHQGGGNEPSQMGGNVGAQGQLRPPPPGPALPAHMPAGPGGHPAAHPGPRADLRDPMIGRESMLDGAAGRPPLTGPPMGPMMAPMMGAPGASSSHMQTMNPNQQQPMMPMHQPRGLPHQHTQHPHANPGHPGMHPGGHPMHPGMYPTPRGDPRDHPMGGRESMPDAAMVRRHPNGPPPSQQANGAPGTYSPLLPPRSSHRVLSMHATRTMIHPLLPHCSFRRRSCRRIRFRRFRRDGPFWCRRWP